jgi:hypothetical protein
VDNLVHQTVVFFAVASISSIIVASHIELLKFAVS